MALNKLKSLFSENLNNQETESDVDESFHIEKPVTENYEDWGFKKGGHLNGSQMGLLQCLARIREDHKRMVRKDAAKQRKLKEPLISERDGYFEEIEQKKEERNDIINHKAPSLKNKIQSLEKDIIAIKQNPKDVMPDKMSKVSFYIGLLILMALSIYLFIFYSSASFSAFFKEFSLSEIGVANSIFDPQAIAKAYQDGVTELILIISMPFVFIGLGFLIHKFQEQKGLGKFFKIGMLIFITFIFDAILAYEITEKIYNIKSENSFQDFDPYSFEMAFQTVNFWLIIFAGFVVYLIWGFVFDFTIESYDKINVVKQAVNAKKSEVLLYKEQLEKLDEEKNILKSEINDLKVKCKKLKAKIDGVIIDTAEFDKILHEFLGGWTHWMTANKKTQEEIDQANSKANEFIRVNIKTLETNNLNNL